MAGTGPSFTLTQLIERTADELRKLKKKPPADAVMQFRGCELELAVTLSAEAGGKIKFWLAEVSSQAKGETVSRIKLSFGPLEEDTDIFRGRHIIATTGRSKLHEGAV
jgi:hypothetical protein